MKTGDRHSRRRIADGTRSVITTPAVLRKISEETKRGMGTLPELERLRTAWRETRPIVRRRFIAEVLAPVIDQVWSPEWTASQREAARPSGAVP